MSQSKLIGEVRDFSSAFYHSDSSRGRKRSSSDRSERRFRVPHMMGLRGVEKFQDLVLSPDADMKDDVRRRWKLIPSVWPSKSTWWILRLRQLSESRYMSVSRIAGRSRRERPCLSWKYGFVSHQYPRLLEVETLDPMGWSWIFCSKSTIAP